MAARAAGRLLPVRAAWAGSRGHGSLRLLPLRRTSPLSSLGDAAPLRWTVRAASTSSDPLPTPAYPVSAATRRQLLDVSRAALQSSLLLGPLARLEQHHPAVVLLASPLQHSDRMLAAIARSVAAEMNLPIVEITPADLAAPRPAAEAAGGAATTTTTEG